jgi:hypothetical protein
VGEELVQSSKRNFKIHLTPKPKAMRSEIRKLLNLFPASVLFGLLLVYTSKLYAQLPAQDQVPSREVVSDYIPMAVEGSFWRYSEHIPMAWREMSALVISGDTVINLVKWKKLWQVEFRVEVIVAHYLVGFIRDDIVERKVWVKFISAYELPCKDTTEQLLYDFSMAPGDTIKACPSPSNTSIQVVQNVSEVDVKVHPLMVWVNRSSEIPFPYTREYHVSISNFFLDNAEYRIYEGMGSDFGLIPRFMFSDFSAGEIDFCHGSIPWCSWMRPTSTDGIKIALPLRAYPNPATSRLTLAWDVPLPAGTLTVLDAAGRVVLETPLPPGAVEYETDVAHLPAGVYVARVGASAVRWVRK